MASMEPSPGPAGPGATKGPEPEPESAGVPRSARPFLAWSAAEVAEWVAPLGFPQGECVRAAGDGAVMAEGDPLPTATRLSLRCPAQQCFKANGITGRELLQPARRGLTDLGHMQEIHNTCESFWGLRSLSNRSIALPCRDNMGLFLERKS